MSESPSYSKSYRRNIESKCFHIHIEAFEISRETKDQLNEQLSELGFAEAHFATGEYAEALFADALAQLGYSRNIIEHSYTPPEAHWTFKVNDNDFESRREARDIYDRTKKKIENLLSDIHNATPADVSGYTECERVVRINLPEGSQEPYINSEGIGLDLQKAKGQDKEADLHISFTINPSATNPSENVSPDLADHLIEAGLYPVLMDLGDGMIKLIFTAQGDHEYMQEVTDAFLSHVAKAGGCGHRARVKLEVAHDVWLSHPEVTIDEITKDIRFS